MGGIVTCFKGLLRAVQKPERKYAYRWSVFDYIACINVIWLDKNQPLIWMYFDIKLSCGCKKNQPKFFGKKN
jgi:hypothetical protein